MTVTLPQLYLEQFHAAGFRAVREACGAAFEWVFRYECPQRFLDVQVGGLPPRHQGTLYPQGAEQLRDGWDHGVFFSPDHLKPPGTFSDRFLIAVRTSELPSRVAFDYSFGGAPEAALWKRNELGYRDPGAVALHSIQKMNSLVSYDALSADKLRIRQLSDSDDHTTWLPIAQVSPHTLWRTDPGIDPPFRF